MKIEQFIRGSMLGITIMLTSGTLLFCEPAEAAKPNKPNKPNVLFIIMDDVGIDQLSALGYGGTDAPVTPSINAIAEAGVRFRSTWSMPECSNGRMALLTGRYPFRTSVYQAIGPNDLANSQVSPYDVTVARMMKEAGYKSAFFGKYHLGGPENNQAENGGPGQLGWDRFEGWIGGLPASLDTTAGGVGAQGSYSCGYVPSTQRAKNGEGADSGACYSPSSGSEMSCRILTGDTLGDSPGLACLNIGGILVPNAETCGVAVLGDLKFNLQNAHYVSPLVINDGQHVTEVPIEHPAGRNYRSSIEVNSAIEWINAQKKGGEPWMATVSFSADHTPLQTPPGHLLSAETRAKLAALLDKSRIGTDCNNILVQRLLSDAMIEAMDSELGRLLASTGIASTGRNVRSAKGDKGATAAKGGNSGKGGTGGKIVYDPEQSNTMIVIVGDNGSFGSTVKLPFDAARSKATPYQTGVWVPLVVAGPLVKSPGRDNTSLTNATDVFGLFGEIAGLNPHKVAAPRKIDSVPMLAYLTNPRQPSIRKFNFTEGGLNIQKNGAHNGPCVLGTSPGSCSQTPVSKTVCEDNGGVWWGEGADGESVIAPVKECWEVNQAIYNDLVDKTTFDTAKVGQSQQIYHAARDARFKLVISSWLDFDPIKSTEGATEKNLEEFYYVNDSADLEQLKLDTAGSEIYKVEDKVVIVDTRNSVPGARKSYQTISNYLAREFASQPACPGDGNGDGVVNAKDLSEFDELTADWTGSSVFDFNIDGVTDELDRDIITANIRTVCRSRR